eukprot:COSAG04_NODE_270_length_18507_cov_125.250380_6_plen_44_part_00
MIEPRGLALRKSSIYFNPRKLVSLLLGAAVSAPSLKDRSPTAY